ncbi:unnamed protein product, partial [Lymnaea stagnalis]
DKNEPVKEVAIQANDFEIERNSSHLPARKRYIPIKFSDYRIFAGGVNVEEKDEEEEEDITFDPEKNNVKKPPNSSSRGRGNARMFNMLEAPLDGHGVKNSIIKVSSGYKCGTCGRIFSLRSNAKAHMITHTDIRPFSCDFEGCGKQLRTKESLRRHQLSHLGIKMFDCKECQKKFSCNASLQEHMACHTGAKPLSCHICNRKFRQMAVLKRHVITHSTDKPFACEVCGKKFAMKVYVQSHMKTHTGERPFLCDTCNKTFAHASDLNRHKIIHTGKKPYACSMCPMRYSDASSRRRHEREHQSKQEFVCPICSQTFSRAGLLRSHVVRDHNSEGLYEEGVFKICVHRSNQNSWYAKGNQSGSVGQDITTNECPSEVAQPSIAHVLVTSSDLSTQVCLTQFIFTASTTKETVYISALKSGSSNFFNETSGVEDLTKLQPGCTYTIVGQDEGGRIYELQLENSSNLTYESLDTQVGMETNDASLTLIKQENDTFTILQQSCIEESTPVHIQPQKKIAGASQWQTETLQLQQTLTNVDHTVEQLTKTMEDNSSVKQEKDIKYLELNLASNLENREITFLLPDQLQDEDNGPVVYPQSVSSQGNNGAKEIVLLPVMDVTETKSQMPDYVYEPDLNSQDYYNWLSSFTEDCKTLHMPLDKDMFQKISHVQKTLSDFMALPTGVITDKNNFKVLMSITGDLSDIIGAHLAFMYQNLT